jgi:hypothetical protein
VPEDCTIGYKGAAVLKVSFDMNLVIRLVIFLFYQRLLKITLLPQLSRV